MRNFMQTFKAYSVVVVLFPFTDKHTTKKPTLVISQAEYQQHTRTLHSSHDY